MYTQFAAGAGKPHESILIMKILVGE